ncbi:alkaline shock protein asp23 [Lucifera butyrica]|uniref:Alkaline shock protein asp23 n=1 Tax=Lucifera butyrica TaxID=1351585 RepID=A0A498RD70_9FIRM|nr:alkaline shock response membrane anchor protein AmaP [Lucifera butyrica]VBB08013.1 alkaline shock protein asp23 [Lucifera butyrica]
MGIIDRVILSIYTVLLALLSLGIILLGLSLVSLDWLWTGLQHVYGRWEAALIGAVFFMVSIRLLLAGVRSRHAKDTIVHHTDMGDVHISINAIENLVEKAARHTRGVRGVKVAVGTVGEALKVNLKVIVSPESNVPAVSAEMQNKVNEYIKNTVGVELVDVRILVENISNEFKPRQRVE